MRIASITASLSVAASLTLAAVDTRPATRPASPPADERKPAGPAGRAAATSVRGMTISCQTWGWEWGSDAMVESMAELRDLGVNWITIHPYAGIRADGGVRMSRRFYGDTAWLTRPIEEAHRLGLKIMIKPHIAYWGSPFDWRGAIEFETDEQWRRFFESYRTWITRVAELSVKADAFAVGTELDRTIHHETQWRQVIAAVRETLGPSVPLTYAANWTDYRRVPFWDDLDAIGVQAYFPLAREPGLPDRTSLDAAWRRHAQALAGFAKEHELPVVFTELGYARSERAAIEPWSGREGGKHAVEVQRRCLASALDAIERTEVVVGVFLWKWFAGPHTRENFLMTTPPMRTLIGERWGAQRSP